MNEVVINIVFTKKGVSFAGSTPLNVFINFFNDIARNEGRPMITTTRKNIAAYLNGLFPNQKSPRVIKNFEVMENQQEQVVALTMPEYENIVQRLNDLELKANNAEKRAEAAEKRVKALKAKLNRYHSLYGPLPK